MYDNTEYEDKVWKNARVLSKRLHINRNEPEACEVLMKNEGFDAHETKDVLEALFDVDYFPDTMGYNDGPGLEEGGVLDEAVYETAKEAYRRIHGFK